MTLEQIEYFIAAVESASFSEAARQLFVSHSSVSRGVSVLENELGVQLLTRGRRTLLCTEAGEVFYQRGKALLRQAEELRSSVTEFRRQQKLRLISIGIYAPRFFELCRGFQRNHPAIELIMEQGDQRSAIEKLNNGEADMSATFSYWLPKGHDYETLVLERGSFCALVSPHHELAGRDFLTSEELIARNDILGENPFHTIHAERKWNRTAQPDLHSILLQIKTGSGITVLPEHAAAEYGQGCVRLPIQGSMMEYQLVLIWNRENPSRALMEAASYFRQQLGQDV